MTFSFDLNPALFFSTFGLVFLAELPDKTSLATLMLASRNHPLAVFYGVAMAFLFQCAIAVLFGSLFTFLPQKIIHVVSGLLFLIFAFWMWRKREQETIHLQKTPLRFSQMAGTSFMVIFIAEWGDLTQLLSATLVAKTHQVFTVFLASVLALWSTTMIFIFIGHHTKKLIKPSLLQPIAAVVFAIVGVLLLTGWWR